MAELNGKTIVAILTKGHPTKTQTKIVTENGTVTPDEGYDAFSSVTVEVPAAVVEEYDGTVSVVTS